LHISPNVTESLNITIDEDDKDFVDSLMVLAEVLVRRGFTYVQCTHTL
jgi:hypothetical protein